MIDRPSLLKLSRRCAELASHLAEMDRPAKLVARDLLRDLIELIGARDLDGPALTRLEFRVKIAATRLGLIETPDA